jgi:Ca2+-binding RTX toxin-like protein
MANPIAVDDTWFISSPQGVSNKTSLMPASAVVRNDTDADGDTLTVTAVANPTNGNVQLLAGVIHFTPTAGATTASFEYTVDDGNGGSDTGVVSIDLAPTTQGIDNITVPASTLLSYVKGLAGSDTVIGGNGADTLLGGSQNDSLDGGDGNDRLESGWGRDTLTGGEGNDVLVSFHGDTFLHGGEGSDTIFGNGINNVLDGGTGADELHPSGVNNWLHVDDPNDVIIGVGATLYLTAASYTLGAGAVVREVVLQAGALDYTGNDQTNDRVFGNDDDNELAGEGRRDYLSGGAGIDTLLGGADRDTLDGGAGADSMAGGNDNDEYNVDDAGDQIEEASGEGTDRVLSTASTYTLSDHVETLTLGAGASNGTGSGQANLIVGNGEENVLSGQGGNDTISGGDQDDSLDGDAGDDQLNGGSGADTAHGGGNNDAVNGDSGQDSLFGDGGNDVVSGGAGADDLSGGTGKDFFRYAAVAESGPGAVLRDTILDFNHAEDDRIHLKGIDTDTGAAGDQGFAYIASSAFTTTGVAQVRWEHIANDTLVQGDSDGDGDADLEILLQGNNNQDLAAGDFIL